MKKLSLNKKKQNINEIAEILAGLYPDAECALKYGGIPWRLLIMGRLSAQCTDARVNIVCKELFEKYPTLESIASASYDEIAKIVKPCGLFNTKAKNIKDSAVMLIEKYDGKLPSKMEELLSLPGVGRKIANLLLGDIFGIPGIVADTHCIRICGRLGMYDEDLKDPTKVEKTLSSLVTPEYQTDFCHRIVQFGRDICTARSPKCDKCPIKELCLRNSTKE